MADIFPASWRTVVVDDQGVAQYPEPRVELEDLAFCDRTARAFRDYESLRRTREQWLQVRETGEREFLNYALDERTNDRLPDPPPEMELAKNITFVVLLHPQSMSQGWITRREDMARNGARVWRGMQRYDAALLICMHACFQVTHVAGAYPHLGDSPTTWMLYVFSPEQPFYPAPTEEDAHTMARLRDIPENAPLSRISVPSVAPGITVLRELFEAFMPEHMRVEFAAVVWNTVRYTVSMMMRAGDTHADRAEWLLLYVRTGLLANFYHNNASIASVFPEEGQPAWTGWEALRPDADAFTAGTVPYNTRRRLMQCVRSVLYQDEPLPLVNGAPATVPTTVLYDRTRRAMSVFYTQTVAPLVIAAACAVGYLRAAVNGYVLPGTDVPGTEPFVPRSVRVHAESLRALTSYTLARLHATLGGGCEGAFAGEHNAKWHPADVSDLIGPTTAVTAEKLLRTWQKSAEPDRHTWIRALEAGLLFMVGGKEEQ